MWWWSFLRLVPLVNVNPAQHPFYAFTEVITISIASILQSDSESATRHTTLGFYGLCYNLTLLLLCPGNHTLFFFILNFPQAFQPSLTLFIMLWTLFFLVFSSIEYVVEPLLKSCVLVLARL